MNLARAVGARPQRWRLASVVTVGALLATILASTVPATPSIAAAGTALELASASWVPGFAAPASNVALQLNGTSQYGTVGTASQLRTPTFTLELWIRRTGAGFASTNGTGNFGIPDPIPLITKGRAEAETAAADINYFLGIDASSGELVADFEEARIAQGGTNEGLNHPVLGSTPIAADGAWHHAAATYDGTTWNLYLDGVLDGSAFIDRPAAALTNVPTTIGSALQVAGTPATASGFFAGVVDEVRIWNFARSAAEINATKDVQITSAETGLLGAWNMNAGNGTILADSTGNIATGGLVAAPAAEYASLGTTAQLRSPTFTVELWFSRTAAGAPSASGTGTGGIARPIPLITKGRAEAETAAADVNYFLGIDFDTGTLVADFEEAQIAQGGTTPGLNHPITGTGVIPADGSWHHAAATYDGTNWKLYLDGILDGTLAVGRVANAATAVPTSVGTALTTASAASGFFAGVVDEVRIWNVARTLAQINATKDIEITSAQPNLLGAWNLNAGTGTSLADSSGNAVVGAAVNTPAWVPGFEAPPAGSVPPTIAVDAPADGATGVGTSPSLSVAVDDANGGSLKVSFFGRAAASGNFALLGTNSGVTPGTTSSLTWAGINDSQTFEWFASVTDGSYLVTGPPWTFSTADGPGTVFVGTGDIANCTRIQDEATAAVIDGIAGQIWTTGDNVYQTGTATEFANCYDASWGDDIKARTRPAPGNHDWGTGNLNGYNGYFGPAATDAGGKSYYSYNADANWHVVVLDSECLLVAGGCGATSAQVTWLRADLAANSTKNVVVIWHKPRYGSGTSLADLQPFHDASYEFGVDIILIGHDHFYERLTPIDASGTADATYGARQFIVGTGGAALSGFSSVHPRSVARNNTTYGVLRLTLHPTSYDWEFFPIAGQTFADEGSSLVHGAPPSADQSPDAPTVNAPADDATGIGLSPTLDVDVSDPNGDPMTVTFFGRPLASGNFAQIGENTGVPSGTNTTATWTGLGAGQEYEWFVTVDDETGTPVTTGPTWQFHTVASADPVFVGTGDIASCAAGVTEDTETGNLIRGIDGVIWTTGDNVYPNGTAAEFANCYETTPWGDTSVQSRTRPVPGNHDWGTGLTENLDGYFDYFGTNANEGGTSYYSYDIDANWHVVNLDSECQLVPGGCAAGSLQEQWLRADLAANADQNVIAIWHKPRYSTGTTNYQAMAPLWDAIYDAGVDILLDGHDHIYERTAPMRAGDTLTDPPVADPTHGIRQFTVGTGGEAHHGLTTNVLPTSQVSDDDTFGVLKLTLHATTYDWVFLPIAGSTFTDSGSGSVHDAPDTTAPPPPTIDTAPPSPTASTSASFTFSDTEGGVSFECALDGGAFATCTSPRNYSGLAGGSHTFSVVARDADDNVSSPTSHTWLIDLTPPPVPTINSGPPNPSGVTTASFTFSDTESGVTFECALDGAAFAACTSPANYSGLAAGGHTFAVRARDAVGNVSADATRAWTIDLTPPPNPTINSGPPDPSSVTTASFTFSDTEGGVTFECALDGAAFAACTSPRNYSGLAAGGHSFAVRARDAAGNLSSAATHAWTIELPTTVTTTLRAIADSYTDASSPTTNYGTSVKLRVDGSPVVRSYLRFDLSSIPGTISSATLRIWALSSQSVGWTARSVTGAWTELGINSNNAPTLGASVGGSGAVATGTWTSVNVTALVGSGTTLDIGVNTASTTALSLSSDESGAATAPQLVVISGGGPPPGDNEDPTMPGNLQATAPLSTQVHLMWTASTDNVGVTGYTIYRNGAFATTVGGTVTSWNDNGRTPSTTYTYAIEAFDAAGNISVRTATVSITTPAGGSTTTTTLRSIADSYVDANKAGTNYGTNVKLRVDGSPAIRTYVRFDLSGLSGTITRATLRMWATSSQSSGWQARSVNGAWAELTLTSSNAPSLGAPIGSSGAVSAGSWTTVDVTALLSAGTTLNIGLTTTSTTALAMSSREAGTTTAPQLVVETTN